MAKKTSHPSIKKQPQGKPFAYEYWSFMSQTTHKLTAEFVERFAEQYHTWALNTSWRDGDGNEPLTVEQWFISQGMPSETFYYLVRTHPVLEKTHRQVKSILGSRRTIGAIKRRYESGHISSTQYKYDDDFLSERERISLKAKLKAEEEKKIGPQNFNIIKGCPDCVCMKCKALFLENK